MTLPDARADFLLSRRIAGCTAKTLAYYAQGLDALERFCAAQGVADTGRLTPTLLRAFVGDLLQRPALRPMSARTYWCAVRAFARWCHAEGAGVSIDRVAVLAGHANIATTARYTRPTQSDLAAAVNAIAWPTGFLQAQANREADDTAELQTETGVGG